MNTFSQVWVFSDTPSRLPELMNGAQALANNVDVAPYPTSRRLFFHLQIDF